MFARMRRMFDGAGWFPGLAAALFVFALLAALLELQSSDAVRWTGQRVTGTEIGGIVSYRWHGQTYSLNAQGQEELEEFWRTWTFLAGRLEQLHEGRR